MQAAIDNQVKWVVSKPIEKTGEAPSITAKALKSLKNNQKSVKAKSIAPSVTSHLQNKNKLDFPDYYAAPVDKGPFVPLTNDFSSKVMVADSRQAREKDRIFVTDLFKNDRNSYFKLVEISDLYSQNNVDLRQIAQFKNIFITDDD
mgnify:CR=1 FL=1